MPEWHDGKAYEGLGRANNDLLYRYIRNKNIPPRLTQTSRLAPSPSLPMNFSVFVK